MKNNEATEIDQIRYMSDRKRTSINGVLTRKVHPSDTKIKLSAENLEKKTLTSHSSKREKLLDQPGTCWAKV